MADFCTPARIKFRCIENLLFLLIMFGMLSVGVSKRWRDMGDQGSGSPKRGSAATYTELWLTGG
jgi:hypothetical protein